MKARLLFNRDGTPFVGSAAEWAESCGLADRAVAKTYLARGRVLVSTVFLGLDHSLSPTGSPILFETMVFRSRAHVDMERYGTEREARLGHLRMVSRWQWRAWLEWVPWRAIREFWRRLMEAIPARRTRVHMSREAWRNLIVFWFLPVLAGATLFGLLVWLNG